MQEPSFRVQSIPIYGNLILAPMDGFSDLPFRSICRSFGSAMSYTSFVGAIELLSGQKRAWQELRFLEQERPVVFQIFDNDEQRLLQAALKIVEKGPDILDINMGCAARNVARRGAGAGLLRDPDKIGRIMQTLTQELDVPVSAKIRLGWDQRSRNFLHVAQNLEANGCALIAVHARTKEQGYGGKADWDSIAAIKEAVSIPVIGNGDVTGVDDIDRILEHTRCDGVMIGRAAIGNPWIFRRQARTDVPLNEIVHGIHLHLGRMLAYYGEERGILLFRKHLVRYLEAVRVDSVTRRRLLTLDQPSELKQGLAAIGLSDDPPAE